MSRVTRWFRALGGLDPIGFTPAVGLAAVGAVGAVTIRPILLVPADAPLWVGIWWIGLVASLYLLARGSFALVGMGMHRLAVPLYRIRMRIPYVIQSPIIRRPRVVVPPPYGFMDFEVFAEEAIKRVTRTLVKMTKDLGRGAKMTLHYAGRFESGGSLSSVGRRNLSREFAAKLDPFARRMARHEARLRPDVEDMATNYVQRLKAIPPGTDLALIRGQMEGMRKITKEGRASQSGYRTALMNMRGISAERYANEAVDRLIEIVGMIISDFDRTVRFTTEAITVIDGKSAPPPPKKGKKGK